jgi:hypothetical protein
MMSGNVRNLRKFEYYMEDMECKVCLHYAGKKLGCKLEKCCCEDEKRDALAHNRVKRPKGWFNRMDE